MKLFSSYHTHYHLQNFEVFLLHPSLTNAELPTQVTICGLKYVLRKVFNIKKSIVYIDHLYVFILFHRTILRENPLK